jgi:hypothetical protein
MEYFRLFGDWPLRASEHAKNVAIKSEKARFTEGSLG